MVRENADLRGVWRRAYASGVVYADLGFGVPGCYMYVKVCFGWREGDACLGKLVRPGKGLSVLKLIGCKVARGG